MYHYSVAGAVVTASAAVATVVWGCLSGNFALATSGAGLMCAAIFLAALAFFEAPLPPSRPEDSQLRLLLRGLKVAAVFRYNKEVLVHLMAGFSSCPANELLAPGCREAEGIYLTWRCAGTPSSARLMTQLSTWQEKETLLRLVACRGRAAVLMEDEQHWLRLPELAARAQFIN